LRPGPDEVHLWRAPLDLGPERLDRLACLLTPDEAERAARLRAEEPRRRFIAARGVLRELLGRCLGAPPEALRFAYAEHGKPRLVGVGAETLRFNLAHSGGLALYAVAAGRDVGVDVECVRATLGAMRIAERFFAPAEIAWLREQPEAARQTAFFRLWTCKEAFLKATGEGVTRPLREVEVSLGADEETATVTRRGAAEAPGWSLRVLRPAPDHVGALAAEGSGWRLHLWSWAGEGAPLLRSGGPREQ
jgi:4'-phosphopantetheinyl transferase